MKRWGWLITAVVMAAGCAPMILRGPLPGDARWEVPLRRAADSTAPAAPLGDYYQRARKMWTSGDWVKLQLRDGSYQTGWVPSAWVFKTTFGARVASIDALIEAHPEMSPGMMDSLDRFQLAVGMPADAAIVIMGKPDGEELLSGADGLQTRWTWIPAWSTSQRVPSGDWNVSANRVRMVVTIRDDVIVGIRTGSGVAEDAYR